MSDLPDLSVPDVWSQIGPRHELDMGLLALDRLLREEIEAMVRWDMITEQWDQHAQVEADRHARWLAVMRG